MVISEKIDGQQCEPLCAEAGMLYVCTCSCYSAEFLELGLDPNLQLN